MKKIIVSILAVFYLWSSTGATVHMHYCMGKMINWSLIGGEGDKCGNCGMETDSGCCKEEFKVVKNTIDQKTTESAIELMQISTAAIPVITENFPIVFPLINTENFFYNSSYRSKGTAVYILNCVFRI